MTAISGITITPSAVSQAYASAAGSDQAGPGTGTKAAGGFGAALSGAIGNVLQTGQQADQLATAALTGSGISGQADLTNIVTSVSKAQLALQTSVAIRDRMVQAYQTIMNMPM